MHVHRTVQLERLPMTRIAAKPEALDKADFGNARLYRVAPDELYVDADVDALAVDDEYAILTKEASLSGVWLSAKDAKHFLVRECAWQLPEARPAFAQGAIAHLPVKLYLEKERALIMTFSPFAHDLAKRLSEVLA